MKIIPADPTVPLYGPASELIDPVEGVTVDDLDVFWHRRIRAGEAVIAADRPARPAKAD